ncbi:MAG: PTS sugar transporter subunit IIA [Pseudomonadota bacterium]|nr:PTS sugar transporter subunit IIA [Pseudomonadota bacterium]|tara:strand:- start:640 stop:1098 length:459 start_codon:yes stop_codon:yes gene_type:complete
MIKIKLEDSHVSVNDSCKTKKSILEKISDLLSKPSGVSRNDIFKKLYEREKLGSTSIGKGVAIPHARIQNIEYPFLSIIILDEPVEFDNIDNLDVDIIVSIIVPEKNYSKHLELLAYLSSKLDDPSVRRELRLARNSSQIIKNLYSENLEFI